MLFVFILLFLLPFMSWFGQYYFSRRNGLLDSFQAHWMCYRGDWIFIPINAIFLFSVHISPLLALFIVPATILNLFSHFLWGYENQKKRLRLHFYVSNTARLSGAGIVHFIFSTIQTTVFFGIFFLSPIIPFIFGILFLMALFSGVLVYCSYRMHERITYDDMIVGMLILGAVLIKLVTLLDRI